MRPALAAGINGRHGGGTFAQDGNENLGRDVESESRFPLYKHAQIAAWIAEARTPERILQMPAPLWRSLELASVLLNVDPDLLQPPLLEATS